MIFRSPPPRFLRGDLNGDSRVNITDPIWLLREAFRGGSRTICRDAADVDDNGQVNVSDAVRLLAALFRGGEPPSPPFPECGTDPGGDADGVACLGSQPGCGR